MFMSYGTKSATKQVQVRTLVKSVGAVEIKINQDLPLLGLVPLFIEGNAPPLRRTLLSRRNMPSNIPVWTTGHLWHHVRVTIDIN